ncbi:ABC transporter ATP-binding protein [Ancylobacter pratisalsi]|uniref:sn-glycerol-3-phosphate ABC transporter ATP-binding protein UgpC n=1 Tax=Ancylobacter pratisalsi TaxID=1745854 RepID=A0A6P1YJH7_9HYPH|nr:sn-glycerol-3-phosphate ABC transporter ATP-binding protein UgpC [Ancylobacter pratisalsi]QIB33302.1 sn-glycerol-3-phosphate ABC transporter ATP-binding protein UgpC [Ancylobacter pratisalsi]
MAQLTLRNLTKSFGRSEIIHGIDLDVAKGEFVVFVGPSGCGKSTLLRLIAGLEEITSGELMFDGERVNDLPPKERGIAMVFQSYALYPHMSVFDNMAFGLKLAKNDGETIRERVVEAARLLELEPLLERKPRELSGGQRQRVAIGRAIVRNPRVFLFDEPLSNLDAALRGQTRVEIARLHERMPDTTMVYVTHDQVEAMTLADRIVVLREGRVEQVGAPMELYLRPATRFVAEFIGTPAMNIIPAQVTAQGQLQPKGGAPLDLDLPASAGALSLGVRPEDLHIAEAGEPALYEGRVMLVERLGESQLVHLEIGHDVPLVVKLPRTVPTRRGETLRVSAREEAFHLFDESGRSIGRPPA